jgi:hypothetical protein
MDIEKTETSSFIKFEFCLLHRTMGERAKGGEEEVSKQGNLRKVRENSWTCFR